MPAVIANFKLGDFAILSAVRYAGQNGWDITTSALGNSLSNTDPGPSLSDVTTRSWPRSVTNCLNPSSPETDPSSWPGVKSIERGEGIVCPSG